MKKGKTSNKTDSSNASTKKKTEKEAIYVDGQVNRPRTIAECLGIKDNTYPTSNRDEYKSYLDTLNLAQLHRHGLEVAGVRPNSDRKRMYHTLMGEFDKFQRKTRANHAPPPIQPKMTPEIEKLLNPY